ncbi:MAG: hypothetical protein K6T81_11730 [Alicyclobacillus macrosporangiidus]|uniref:hypothetical protein n=1 Tax=Alicyclobacillus macrosporangiidus TaxID=392015 RepID=UPI0026EE1B2E|nr:hypothetical protein [Alicyclobacillus macrosporangiidus]MCL6599395.1 hypothetical protein [Alicyclobacillus macrosporangiidus]
MPKPRSKRKEDEPQYAPGLDGVAGLQEKANPDEIARGEFTRVTQLVWDEYDPSRNPED